jgi:hypothetical protein
MDRLDSHTLMSLAMEAPSLHHMAPWHDNATDVTSSVIRRRSAAITSAALNTLSISPSPAVAGFLNATTAIGASNIWAVCDVGNLPLAEHFDGTSWSVIASPSFFTGHD